MKSEPITIIEEMLDAYSKMVKDAGDKKTVSLTCYVGGEAYSPKFFTTLTVNGILIGCEDGSQVYTTINQVSFKLTTTDKVPKKPAREIGFHVSEGELGAG